MVKYEIELVIPIVNTQPKYKQRLLDFKKVGLLNIPPNKKIKVALLIQKDTEDDTITQGWPENCDAFVYSFDNDFHISKLCKYYLSMSDFDSKWYAQIDDDSINNVGGLIKTFSYWDYNEPIYFSTPGFWIDKPHPELSILKKLGLFHLLEDWWHDWESHFCSRTAMMQTLLHPISRKYIKARQYIFRGFSDHFMPYATKIAGIKLTASDFSSPHPMIHDFSLFGGHLHHIHYISHDYGNIGIFREWVSRRCTQRRCKIKTAQPNH